MEAARQLTDAIPRAPEEEVQGDGNRLLRLAGDVAGNHGQREGLRTPKGETDVVTDQKADATAQVVGKVQGHDEDGANE